MNDGSTAVTPSGCCPFCSGPGNYVLHSGHCPQVAAEEYHPNGRLKRIEFVDSPDARIAGLHQGCAEVTLDFDAPLELADNTKWAREVVIEESTLLEPGTYTIVAGELFRVINDTPPGLAPLPDNALQRLVDRALQELPSPDWERELGEL